MIRFNGAKGACQREEGLVVFQKRPKAFFFFTVIVFLLVWMFIFLLLCFQMVLVLRLTAVCLIKDSLDAYKR